ncbi:MAG: hypothetical protein C0511_05735 [Hyphomicrobium sp.]|nr:hypothetical protein [Hyphomicrobium sp.]PPC82707.1 MAG: hypothetical protein CTY40_04090 [Hyphomicrobium sp.]
MIGGCSKRRVPLTRSQTTARSRLRACATSDAGTSGGLPTYQKQVSLLGLGIFGRAMQFGVPVIVRRGSLIERVATATPLSVIKVDFADKNGLADALRAPWPRKLDESQMVAHAGKIGSWRQEFIRGLEKVLEFSRPLDDI